MQDGPLVNSKIVSCISLDVIEVPTLPKLLLLLIIVNYGFLINELSIVFVDAASCGTGHARWRQY